MKEVAPNHCY